jgi:hypothetical protein
VTGMAGLRVDINVRYAAEAMRGAFDEFGSY